MSAVAACWRRDARTASPDDLRAPVAAAAHRAGGPFHFACAGSAALASTSRPFRHPQSNATVIVDGVLDNADELARALDVRPEPGAVALAAFERWGVDAGTHLLGDFVVIVHEPRAGRLTAIRDPLGQRPLFYGTAREAIVLASEAQQIVRHPVMAPTINDAMIAEHLSDAPTTAAETIWRDVYRVPPGHAVEISAAGIQLRRYWDLDDKAALRLLSDDDYADRFAELFRRAVECRLRGIDRVGVFLSGGIDSSSVAGMAQEIRRESGASPVHAFSAAFPGRACDEATYIDAVVGMWRLPSTRVDVVLPTRAELEAYADRYLDLPMTPGPTADVLRQRAADIGITTLLTGCGGDDYFSGSPLRPLATLRSAGVLGLARAAISPILSNRVRRLLRPVFGGRPPRRPWITPAFASRTRLEDRLRARSIPSFGTREQREIYAIVRGLPQILGDEIEDRAAHAAGVTQRHPFYDRRVVEFGFALPPAQRMQGRRHKVVVRRAMRAHLPAAVAAREDKAEFSHVYTEAFAAIGADRIFSRLQSAERGWVDAAVAGDMYRRMKELYSCGDDAYIGLALRLWTIVALELWLERVARITSS